MTEVLAWASGGVLVGMVVAAVLVAVWALLSVNRGPAR